MLRSNAQPGDTTQFRHSTLDRLHATIGVRARTTAGIAEGAGTVMLDPSLAGIDMIRMLSDEDFPDTGIRVAQDGSIAAR